MRRAVVAVLQSFVLMGLAAAAHGETGVVKLARDGSGGSPLADDVDRLPMRYETRVAEGGSNLSGGQRQRLAIARAVVTDPSILMLDEASSHLDVASEARLNASLERLRCTRIVIAHRLTAVRAVDQILVLDRGRIVERGRHTDLVAAGGTYAVLAAAQATATAPPHLGSRSD